MTTPERQSHRPGHRKRIGFAFITIVLSTAFSLLVAEQALRFLTIWQKHNHPDYPDTFRTGGLGPGGLLKEGFSARVVDGYGGTVRWQNNGQGFRNEKDFTRVPAPGTLRILSLGDSFTAGYRVDQEETYSRLMEHWSQAAFRPTELMISCIESPDVGLKYLRDHGHTWSPHLVLLGITLGNDIAQSYVALHGEPIASGTIWKRPIFRTGAW